MSLEKSLMGASGCAVVSCPDWVKKVLLLALDDMLGTSTVTMVGSELPGCFDGWSVMRCYPKFPGDSYMAWCIDSHGRKWQASIDGKDLRHKRPLHSTNDHEAKFMSI